MTLALAETAPSGTWTLEAHIDGELTGAYTFQIFSGDRLTDAAPVKRMLSPSEIYQLALASTVSIEKIGTNGEIFGVSSGFISAPGIVLSAFQAIDGAIRVRLTYSDGRRVETDQVSAWDRYQDWVAIKADAGIVPALQNATSNSLNVGDFASYLEVASEGNRVISEARIIGQSSFGVSGARLTLSLPISDKAIGAALLNEYGDVMSRDYGREPCSRCESRYGTGRYGPVWRQRIQHRCARRHGCSNQHYKDKSYQRLADIAGNPNPLR